jgi:hypothetical protein
MAARDMTISIGQTTVLVALVLSRSLMGRTCRTLAASVGSRYRHYDMRPVATAVFLMLSSACARATPAASATCSEPSWRSSHSADSTVALCAPPQFRAGDDFPRWARGDATDSNFAVLSLHVLDSTAAAREWGPRARPRRFSEPTDTTQLHAVRADSVVNRIQSVDGRQVEVETARLTGGIGFSNQAALLAFWWLPNGHLVLVQGLVSQPEDLEVLRAMVETLRFSK